MQIDEQIKVQDAHGFLYLIGIKHHPTAGVSIAHYEGERIASIAYGKFQPPAGDDDKEWEEWEERFAEWKDAITGDLKLACQEHFNKKTWTQ